MTAAGHRRRIDVHCVLFNILFLRREFLFLIGALLPHLIQTRLLRRCRFRGRWHRKERSAAVAISAFSEFVTAGIIHPSVFCRATGGMYKRRERREVAPRTRRAKLAMVVVLFARVPTKTSANSFYYVSSSHFMFTPRPSTLFPSARG